MHRFKSSVRTKTITLLVGVLVLLVHGLVNAHQTDLISALALPDDPKLCGEAVPMNIGQVRERYEKEMLLSVWDRPQVVLWLKRAHRFFPHIEQRLKDMRLPEDLKFLAVAESALRPHAGSPKGAMGFWQLMPHTARRYGLRVDRFIDERRNLHLSTTAALKYLKVLHEKFGSWTMALAAYNMGEEGLAAEVLAQDTKNYYHLYLPLETQRFIFRILAVKLIMTNPAAYGVELGDRQAYKPLSFDTVGLDCFEEIPIQLIAKASGSHFKTIKDLNPHLRGHYIQPGHYQVNLPAGRAKGFDMKFKRLVEQYSRELQQRVYVVQQGDSLTVIAEKFKVPLAAILIWNRLDMKRPIHPGDRLIIYPRGLKDVQP